MFGKPLLKSFAEVVYGAGGVGTVSEACEFNVCSVANTRRKATELRVNARADCCSLMCVGGWCDPDDGGNFKL